MKNVLLTLCLLALAAAHTDVNAATETQSGVVQVLATHQSYEQLLPWQKQQPGSRRGYGIRIAKDEILTTEALVRNSTLVELRLSRSGRKISATVLETAPSANLAILKVTDAASLGDLPIHAIAKTLDINAPSTIAQFDATREVQTGEAKHIKVALSFLPNGGGQALLHTLQTDLVINGRGAAVLQDNAIAGLVSTYATTTRSATVIAPEQIRDFVDSVRKGEFEGFATAGFSWASLDDPQKRAYLGAADDSKGVLVLSTRPGSGAAKSLKPQDLILTWDGLEIDSLGYYTDPSHGRLLMPYLIKGRRKPGDSVPVTVLRGGKEVKVEVTLSNIDTVDSLIQENITGERPEFLLEGGILIRELSGRYLRAYGESWNTRINARLVHTYYTQNRIERDPGERIVIIARVIPDRINRGYANFANNIITHLNGTPVKNMEDVFKIRNRDTHISKITLHSIGVDLVLDPQELPAANKRILSSYRIPSLHYKQPETDGE